MTVSSVQPGYQLIEQSSKMAEEAALEINQQPSLSTIQKDQSLDFNKVEFKAPETPDPSYVDSMIKLNQANQYSKIGTNVLQRDQEMIGTLLDIHV
ncbi:hypothetical protein VISI1226_16128 [Vibrio sinaloensis DSM 21326]|uniref:Flagellar basal-body/hook protein C-terminal domain-containing protein n=1 Tax=Vibrio sinaloensis DSM 21326 TaxID=945550 RepID=E8M5T3_PHOS4|nr:hypothetical protein [Vibrio sinaloensis]EGA70655.1 hypothetical protein VISI1226_16128 [Vibrio sinaloensis DSM 21326]